MELTHRSWIALATSLFLTVSAGQTLAKGSTIKVSLWDKGAMSMNMLGKGPDMGMGPEMGMMMGNAGTRPVGITLSTQTVKAGEVTFAVQNSSKTMVHEMVLSPVKDENTALPYDKAALKVNEDEAGHLGEVAELEPGKRGALTLDLKPGKYILYCNIPGHYVLGMWTLLSVK